MKHLHFNNSIHSKQDINEFSRSILTQIMNNREGLFTLSINDGDGDVYKYTISVDCERVENIKTPINEN